MYQSNVIQIKVITIHQLIVTQKQHTLNINFDKKLLFIYCRINKINNLISNKHMYIVMMTISLPKSQLTQ